jgi:hypothetical protein
MSLLPPKCYEQENVPQFFFFHYFHFEIRIWIFQGICGCVAKPYFYKNFHKTLNPNHVKTFLKTLILNFPKPLNPNIPDPSLNPLNALIDQNFLKI